MGAAAALALVALTTGAFSAPATAAGVPNYRYVNLEIGQCLDSNYAGDVYTLGRNGGRYQAWLLHLIAQPDFSSMEVLMKQRQLTRRAIPGLLGFVLLLGGLAAPVNASPAPSAGGAPASISAGANDTGSLPSPGDVHASQTPYTYVNRATGRCLDSNYAGDVYTLGCNGGSYQKWEYIFGVLVNTQTGRCLDSNYAGDVYTLPCNDGAYQVWVSSNGTNIVNRQTFLCLDSNFAGDVYTLGCNGGDYQKWSARL